jgi:hypothetical protein
MEPVVHKSMTSALSIPAFVIAWFAIVYVVAGPLALAYVPLFTGGFFLWWFTTRRTPVDPGAIIGPYLVTVVAFIIHVFEEYKSVSLGYPGIAPLPATFIDMVTFAASLAPILWLLGAVMMLRGWATGYFVASTFMFGMMFIEPTHFLAPFLQGSGAPRYVAGLWTAILPAAMGWFMFLTVRREIKRTRDINDQ